MWTAVSLSLRAQVSDAVWYSTFNDVHALGVTEDTLRLAVPSGTVRDKILSRYYPIVLDAMAAAGAGSRNLVVEIVAPETAVIDVTPTLTVRPGRQGQRVRRHLGGRPGRLESPLHLRNLRARSLEQFRLGRRPAGGRNPGPVLQPPLHLRFGRTR